MLPVEDVTTVDPKKRDESSEVPTTPTKSKPKTFRRRVEVD